MKKHFQKGVSLLETMLVLAIVAVLVVMSARYYDNYKRTGDIVRFQTSVAQLMDALNVYYFTNCQKPTVTDVDLLKLQEAGLIGNNLYNPWGNFAVDIQNNNGLFVLKVTAFFNVDRNINIQQVSFMRGALNGDPSNPSTTITWTRLPSHSTSDLLSRQWVNNAASDRATNMNAGMGSKLWILNSELQIFSKQQSKTVCPN